jgi:hypothetical protein
VYVDWREKAVVFEQISGRDSATPTSSTWTDASYRPLISAEKQYVLSGVRREIIRSLAYPET